MIPRFLVDRLRNCGDLELIGGMAYLAEVARSVPNAAHAIYYAQIVRDKSTLRQLILSSTEILRDAYDDSNEPREMLNHAEERIFAILDKRGGGELSTIAEILHESMARIDSRMKHEHAVGGIETGFSDYDNLTGGLHDSAS